MRAIVLAVAAAAGCNYDPVPLPARQIKPTPQYMLPFVQPHYVTWADVWMNADGTAGVIVGDNDMLMYDGYQLPECSVSYTDVENYYTIGPCLLHTPLDDYVTVTLTVYDDVEPQQYDSTHTYILIDSEASFSQ